MTKSNRSLPIRMMESFGVCWFRTALLVAVVAGSSVACGGAPRPKALNEAKALIGRADTSELESLKPKLIKEARAYLAKAERAYELGELEKAKLNAHLAMQKYHIANNFVGRASARNLTKVMARRGQEAKRDADRERDVASALESYQRLDRRVEQVTIQLDEDAEEIPEAAAAKKGLVSARKKQADAIGVGAPDKAPDEYNRGKTLVESALESIELGLYTESSQASAQAVAAFDTAMRAAGKKSEAKVDRKVKKTNADRQRAERALDAAEDARAGAAKRSGGNSPEFSEPDFALDLARRAFKGERYRRAESKANQARRGYDSITGQGSLGGGRVAQGASAGTLRALAEAKIVDLQFKRSELLGQLKNEQCPGPFREFESILELAEKRFNVGDYPRAYEFAIRAQERLRKCDSSRGPLNVAVKPATNADRQRAEDALRKAQTAYARARVKDSRSQILVQGKQLLSDAERWFNRGSYKTTTKLATEAAKLFRGVKAGTGARAKKRGPAGNARAKAEKALEMAQEAQARVATKLGDDDPRLKRPDRLLAAAERWYERDSFARAASMANRANQVYKLLEKGGAAKKKAGKALTKKRTKKRGAAACTAAKKAIADARALGRTVPASRLSPAGKLQRRSGLSLVRSAQRELGRKSCASAQDIAFEAVALLENLPERGEDGRVSSKAKRGGASTHRSRSGTRTASSSKALGLSPPEEGASGAWQQAYARNQEALRARDRAKGVVNDSNRAVFKRGEGALGRAQGAYEDKDYSASLREADMAIAYFDAMDPSGSAPALTVQNETEEGRAVPSARPRLSIEQRVDRAIVAYEASGKPAPDGWQSAYRLVIKALVLRDRAEREARHDDADDQDNLKRGRRALEKASRAWDKRDMAEAKKQAAIASSAFEKVLNPDAKVEEIPPPPKSEADDGSAEFKSADAAVRAAIVILKVCEKRGCEERDLEAFTKASAEVNSAKEALDAGKFGYAEELAKQAKVSLYAILEKPRPNQEPPKEDPEKLKKLKKRADDLMREMVVAFKLCQTRGCAQTNYESWLRAEQVMSASRASYADKNYQDAGDYAEKATKEFRAILDATPEFKIPDDAKNITRSGDQLLLNPTIKFHTGSSVITPGSQPSIRQLAKVLKTNQAAITRIRLVGYTDSVGNADKNKRLSRARAKSVLNALKLAGAPGKLIESEGRGEENPVASNKTAEGRKQNRRVEVRIETKGK